MILYHFWWGTQRTFYKFNSSSEEETFLKLEDNIQVYTFSIRPCCDFDEGNDIHFFSSTEFTNSHARFKNHYKI